MGDLVIDRKIILNAYDKLNEKKILPYLLQNNV
jgi:hypothetical protein